LARPVVALVGLPADLMEQLSDYLERRGYEARAAAEDWSAATLFDEGRVDVAAVDLGMQGDFALELLRRHGSGPLFIMLARSADVVQRVLALELGAADVVDHDIAPRELAARIGGLVSRRGKRGQGHDLLVLENATVDLKAALVMHRSGEEELLSPGQVALLRLFVANPRKVLSREDIIAAAPAEAADAFDRSIDSRIVRLRRKLDTEAITTIRGAGYRFEPPDGV
jgi:DNA-binding response OmpR family regulator